jgi:outer membrane protein assembly factor BamB
MRKPTRLFPVIPSACSFLVLTALQAADWPQYRGPTQTGTSAEKLDLRWPEAGPKVLWKIPTDRGFSSFAISDGKAFTQVNRDIRGALREVCVALDAATGKELWATDVGVGKYDAGGDTGAADNKGGDGPRSTPTINDGLVYVNTQDLVLHCLDLKTGKELWTRDLIKEHAGRNIGWKSAASAVIDGELLFLGGGGAGQSLLAVHKKTGQVVWKGHDEIITHSTPVVATILGERQVIYFLKSGLFSVSAKDGKALWRFPFDFRVSTAISPIVAGDIVYCSAGYDVGGGACKITRQGEAFAATELWKIPGNRDVPNHWSTPVYKDGYLYGMFSFKKFATGPLKCVELATGKVVWEQSGFGAGNVILVNDQLLALTDYGELVVVAATPQAYKELARAKVITGKCWSTPALADGRIYVRSTKEGACLETK